MKLGQKLRGIRQISPAKMAVLVFGIILSVGGFSTVMGFVVEMKHYHWIPAHVLVFKLILPHMLMLSGFGMIVAGVIFITRQSVIRARMEATDELEPTPDLRRTKIGA